MTAIFTIICLGIMAWMLCVSFDAYMRASETLRRAEDEERRRRDNQQNTENET